MKILKVAFLPVLLCLFVLVFLSNTAFSEATSPETPQILKGKEELREGNYEEAVSEFTKAREDDPKSSIAAYYLGISYLKAQDLKNAKTHLKDAVTLLPPVREAVVELSDALYQLGEIEESLKYIDTAEKESIEPSRTAYLKGLCLLKIRKNKEAIEEFKKARELAPELASAADYQIAIATLQEGRLKEAKDIFVDISKRDPGADISQSAKEYVSIIQKREKEERPLKITLGLQYQYDDNVILKPEDESVAGDITNESDSVGVATLRADYDFKWNAPYSLKAQYALYFSKHADVTSHDIQSHSFSLVPGYAFKQSFANLYAGYNYTLVDNEKYLHSVTLSPSYTFFINERQFAQVYGKGQVKDYLRYASGIAVEEDRDSIDYGAGGAWFYLIAGNRGFVTARYDFNYVDTDGANWSYYGNKIAFGLLYPVTEDLKVSLSLEDYIQGFTESHTVFGKKREDNTYTLSALASYPILEYLDLQAQYIYIKGNSNIAVYDYTKNVFSVGFEARF